MKSRVFTILSVLALVATSNVASAQTQTSATPIAPAVDDSQKISIGAVIFTNYTFTSQPTKTDAAGNTYDPNSFDVGRAYINITGQLSHVLAFRITPDIARETGAGSSLSGSLDFRLKYGFAQVNLDDWTGAWKGAWVRVGIQQTPIIDYLEGIYRYRFQDNTWVEKDGGLKSADAGVSFHANLPNNFGDFHVGIYNGEGQAAADPNQEKAIQVRGTLRPLAKGSALAKGWRVTGFYDKDNVVDGAPRTRAIFDTTYEHPRFNAGFDFESARDQSLPTATLVKSGGWSTWVTPFFKKKGEGPEALIRFDDFTPDKTNKSAERKRFIGGIAYWFPHPKGNATGSLLLDFEQTSFPGTITSKAIALHALINF